MRDWRKVSCKGGLLLVIKSVFFSSEDIRLVHCIERDEKALHRDEDSFSRTACWGPLKPMIEAHNMRFSSIAFRDRERSRGRRLRSSIFGFGIMH